MKQVHERFAWYSEDPEPEWLGNVGLACMIMTLAAFGVFVWQAS